MNRRRTNERLHGLRRFLSASETINSETILDDEKEKDEGRCQLFMSLKQDTPVNSPPNERDGKENEDEC
jgi:hypothetical protein